MESRGVQEFSINTEKLRYICMSKHPVGLFFPMLIIAVMQFSCRHQLQVQPAAGTKDSLLVYIMAGQSNMAGRGVIEEQDRVANPRIFTIDSSGNLVIAQEPLHF